MWFWVPSLTTLVLGPVLGRMADASARSVVRAVRSGWLARPVRGRGRGDDASDVRFGEEAGG